MLRLLVCVLSLAACAPGPAAQELDALQVSEPIPIPPFSPEQLRQGLPVGTRMRFLHTSPDAPPITWDELAAHATFPPDTPREVAEIEVAGARRTTWRYTVERALPEGTVVQQLWFDPTLPGPPVLMVTTSGDVELMRMALLERTAPE